MDAFINAISVMRENGVQEITLLYCLHNTHIESMEILAYQPDFVLGQGVPPEIKALERRRPTLRIKSKASAAPWSPVLWGG